MLRWLLPVVAVIALVGSTLTAWASAGTIGEASCCCPVPSECTCHDHDREPGAAPILKKCVGEAPLVAPVIIHAIAAIAPDLCVDHAVGVVATEDREPVPDDHAIEPETPPF